MQGKREASEKQERLGWRAREGERGGEAKGSQEGGEREASKIR